MSRSRPSNQEAKAFTDRLDNYGDALKQPERGGPTYKFYDANRNDAAFRAEHPRYPDFHYPDDKEADTYFKGREALKRGTGANYQITLGKSDVEYIMRKKDAQEMIRFKQFVEDSIPRGTPWAKDFFEKIMPGWYQSKIDIINDKMSIVQKFIDITIRGPQTIDDMFLLYQIYQGRISLPNTFQDLIRPESSGVPDNAFASGLFNPKRYLPFSYILSKRNQDFMANFAIPGIDPKGIAGNALIGERAAEGALQNYTASANTAAAFLYPTGFAAGLQGGAPDEGWNGVPANGSYFGARVVDDEEDGDDARGIRPFSARGIYPY